MSDSLFGSRYNEPWRGLPGEIRAVIWELCACHNQPIVFRDEYFIGLPAVLRDEWFTDMPRNQLKSYPSSLQLSILQTCREAHAVASKSLYSNNAFYLDASGHRVIHFLRSLSKLQRSWIRDIRLSEYVVTYFGGVQYTPNNHVSGNPLEQLLHVLTQELCLSSVTIPIWRDYGIAPDTLYAILGAQVYQGRLFELRLHHKEGKPDEESQKGLGNMFDCVRLCNEYDHLTEDDTVNQLRRTYWDGTLRSETPPPLQRLKPIRDKLAEIIWQHRSLSALQMNFETPEDTESGLVIVVRHDVASARARIQKVEDEIASRGHGFEEEARALEPLRMMRLDERLRNAKQGLDNFERVASENGWPSGRHGRSKRLSR